MRVSGSQGLLDSLRFVAETTTDLAFFCDPAHHLTWISPSCRTLLHREPEELIGRVPLVFIHPDDADAARGRARRLDAGESPEGQERDWLVRVVTAEGAARWMSGTITRIAEPDGSVGGFASVLHDVDDLMRGRARAQAEADRVRGTLDSMLDPFILLEGVRDDHGSLIDLRYVDCNEAAWRYNQLTREEMIGHRLLDLFPGQATAGPLARYFDVLRTGEPCILDDYAYPHEIIGSERRYDIRAVRAGDDLLALTWRDVTDRYRDRRALEVSERMYRLATEDVTDAVLQSDDSMTITWVSPSFEELTGFTPDEVVGRNGLDFLEAPDVAAVDSALRRAREGEATTEVRLRVRAKDGTSRAVSARVRRPSDGIGTDLGYVTVVRDITEEIRMQEELEHVTGHDMLTGLATRSLFEERLDHQLAADPLLPLTVIGVGINGLGRVNEALSYSSGDAVIRQLAARLEDDLPNRSHLARLGGDTFGILAPDSHDQHAAVLLAEGVLSRAREEMTIDDHVLIPTVSVGITLSEPHDTAAELLRRAALAVREAEGRGRDSWAIVGREAAAAAARRLTDLEDLRVAIASRDIEPWFQPVVRLATSAVVGYEVLARWPDGGAPRHHPATFVPFAEEGGMIDTLDRHMVESALDLLPTLGDRHLAVNLSMLTLVDPRTLPWLHQVAAGNGGRLDGLVLEVTETALAQVGDDVAETMGHIRDLGVRWLVDDFGTGYSSISHLRDLPIDGLKLDVSFTRGIATGDERSIALARGLAGLARGLGLQTIAEGVEDEQTAMTLAEAGWEFAQGYLFGQATAEPLG